MAYTALYRKFRPQTFESVIGQEHIVRTLKNQMKTGRVSHAYLFCGTRGTGKTSTAKIFARAINCTNPTADGEPCNECAVCKDILAGRSVNVIEIDAASNNGVDNIREIREEVKYPPTQGKYKVYIIDEVHMLSAAAFNALLKTLEEPPAHVIFILATTDPQKVPATILSRVQRFDFRRITTETIAQTLMGYLKEEGQQATPEAVRYVAHLGDGSMRDSLSILDQCLAFFSGEEVTLEKVLDIMGAVDQTIFFEMTDALAKRDAKEAMLLVEQMMQDGRDVKQFVTELLQHLRNLLMAATLLEIKSKLLLPKPKAEEEEGPDPREELVQRLLEYKRIKDATETLKEREEEAALVYYKEADASVAKLKEQPPQELEDLLQGITMDDLYQAFRQVMARKETKEDKVRSSFRSVQKDLFTVGEKMEYIRDMLILHPHEKTAFHTIFRRNAGKMERVVTFLALLELIKQKEVQITQEKNFGEIFISRYDEGGAE